MYLVEFEGPCYGEEEELVGDCDEKGNGKVVVVQDPDCHVGCLLKKRDLFLSLLLVLVEATCRAAEHLASCTLPLPVRPRVVTFVDKESCGRSLVRSQSKCQIPNSVDVISNARSLVRLHRRLQIPIMFTDFTA